MSYFPWTQSIGAGATFNPLDGWNYEQVPNAGVVTIVHRATAVGLVVTITSGSDQLQQEAPVPAGGTAGQTPTTFNAPPITDAVDPLDKVAVRYRNPTAGAITVDGSIDYTAMGRRRGR